MRPSLLDPLFAPAAALPGIGPKNAKLFDRLLDRPQGARVLDVLFHLPTATLDRRARPKIRDAEPGTIVTFEATVTEHRGGQSRSRAPFKVLVEDDTGDVELVFFLANPEWVKARLPVGATRWISGRLELYDGVRQIVHPDKVMDAEELARLPPVEPVYPLTEGLYQRTVARAADGALKRLPRVDEWVAAETLDKLKLPGFAEALTAMHRPSAPEDVDPAGRAATRLAYDELLSNQLALLLIRARMRESAGRAHVAEGLAGRRLEAALPFSLTNAQRKALDEIRADLRSEKRMIRLLQGDVGSGKTVVALIAMAEVVEAGRQAAMMAPTEVLARQHFERMAPLAGKAGLRMALMTGRDRPAERRETLAALASGALHIVVGTHALFQESVVFADLGLAVVDEQHRFGVRQRLALAAKGQATDLLVMTATPIPRSLVLAYFGDMDVSVLREKPPGRQPIETRAMPIERLEEVVAGLTRALAQGARAYWICPLVEESETLDVAAAEDRAGALRSLFGDAVGLVHGKMAGPDKDAAMERFQRGDTRILVATTVVEVGVDVPAATIMIVEHAERFGLSQLHQLRGRVGRGAGRSSCLLLYRGPLGETAKARIEILRATEDGFRIAEEDLRLRGEGDVLGARQAGAPGFRFARLEVHAGLIARARREAEVSVEGDGRLVGERARSLRMLLYLFERDEAAKLVEAG
ncbi:ATP-dependent DNA helicase RecG [Roseiarcus fermentans]|uniref:Probable DNA 3'-5' helicase RecG n=1 Tax=Roseiarcus fermentans TaxID=1473586 RepID=A0A366ERH1_9HYPH|nr:ATP-dependent DNA helicase RecG [Roseiarcus fermentans]RBP04085.1 ATP-dependent DNA helicase RecG [Roseiarcus fermentans]